LSNYDAKYTKIVYNGEKDQKRGNTGSDIEVRTGMRVSSLDADDRCVVLEDGARNGYESVLLATGSRPYIPPAAF
jgi:NAD(P)H-nitrite reductase large subunit